MRKRARRLGVRLLALMLALPAAGQTTNFVFTSPDVSGEVSAYLGDDAGNTQLLYELAGSNYGEGSVAFDGLDIYATAHHSGTHWIYKNSSPQFPIGQFVAGLAVDSDFLYYCNLDTNSVVRVNKQTGSAADIFPLGPSGFNTVFDIEVAQGEVYWSTYATGSDGIVWKNGVQLTTYPISFGAGFLAADSEGRLFMLRSPYVFEVHPDGTQTAVLHPPLFSGCFSGENGPQDLEVLSLSGGGFELYSLSGDGLMSLIGRDEEPLPCLAPPASNKFALIASPNAVCSASLSVPYLGSLRRVDVHGMPMPERSPTESGEVDRAASATYIDTFSLGPHYSVSDVRVAVEGRDLALEFRRTTAVSAYRHSPVPAKQAITYPSDRILGPGWHTNLASRIALAEEGCLQVPIATVIDEVGTSYRYSDNGLVGPSNPFEPDTFYSLNNQADSATLYRADSNTLVLQKAFGTRLTYERLGTFFPPGGGTSGSQDYYRLESIEDRNGNRIVYSYLSNDPLDRQAFHVAETYEQAHPERHIRFEYALGTGGNGADWGDRLTKTIDALGRETIYSYGPSSGHDWDFLVGVTREAVLDGETGAVVSPTTSFTYHASELPVEETIDPTNPPASDPEVRNRSVAIGSVTDPRGHVTAFEYEDVYSPSSITSELTENLFAATLHLTRLTTDDGEVIFSFIENTHTSVVTEIVDTRGNTSRYEFSGTLQLADNLIGQRLSITDLTRSTPIGSVSYEWSDDAFSNLLRVVDVNANSVEYTYDTALARKSNQPTSETVRDFATGATITTNYDYGTFARRTLQVDGESMQTVHQLDAQGNRVAILAELGSTTLYEYAPDGFVTAMVNPDGRRTEYGRAFAPTAPEHYYTVSETVTGYGNELSLQTLRVYDVLGNLTRLVDQNTNTYEFEYDALYRQVAQVAPISGRAESVYNLNGDPVEERDYLGNSTVYVYDSMNRRTEERRRMQDPDGNSPTDLVRIRAYNAVGRVSSETDPEGNVSEYFYDEALRLVEAHFDRNGFDYVERYEYGPNSGSGAFSYIEGWEPTRTTNRRGFHTDTEYDGFYRPVRIIERFSQSATYGAPPAANEPTTEFVYNQAHNKTQERILGEPEAGGLRTVYTFYDNLHRVAGSAIDFDGDGNNGEPYGGPSGLVGSGIGFSGDPDDQVSVFHLDLQGNRIGLVDPEGNLTETVFDGASRTILVRQPEVAAGTPETATTYDDNGNAVLIVDPNGNATWREFDAQNREIVRVLDLNGDDFFDATLAGDDIIALTFYDAMDNVIERVDSKGFAYTFRYDRAYREIERLLPEVPDPEHGNELTRPAWITAYDRNSNPVKRADPRGVVTAMAYDGLDRLVSRTVASGTDVELVTLYEYDPNGNVVAQVLDNGEMGLQRTEFAFDPCDRQVLETWPGELETQREYYRNDLLRSTLDTKGQLAEHSYDVAGRPSSAVFVAANGEVEEERSFVYDRANNLLVANDLNGTTTLAYDALYRKTTEARTQAGIHYLCNQEFDFKGNPTSTTHFPHM